MRSLVKTENLATGQVAPFTGQWVNTSLCKNGFIVIYVSDSSVDIDLQAKTELHHDPIFLAGGPAEAVTFYNASKVGPGYTNPIFFDSPTANIRLIATNGNAPVYAYITYHN